MHSLISMRGDEMRNKLLLVLTLIAMMFATSCVEVRYITKVQKVYRTPAKLAIPTLPRLSLYEDGDSVFTKENYKKLLKEYSDSLVFTKQLLMLIKEHNKLIAEIEAEEKAAAITEKEETKDAH